MAHRSAHNLAHGGIARNRKHPQQVAGGGIILASGHAAQLNPNVVLADDSALAGDSVQAVAQRVGEFEVAVPERLEGGGRRRIAGSVLQAQQARAGSGVFGEFGEFFPLLFGGEVAQQVAPQFGDQIARGFRADEFPRRVYLVLLQQPSRAPVFQHRARDRMGVRDDFLQLSGFSFAVEFAPLFQVGLQVGGEGGGGGNSGDGAQRAKRQSQNGEEFASGKTRETHKGCSERAIITEKTAMACRALPN